MVSRAESEEKKAIDPNGDEVSETAAKHIIEYVTSSHFKAKHVLLSWSAREVELQDLGVDSCYVCLSLPFFFILRFVFAVFFRLSCGVLYNYCNIKSYVVSTINTFNFLKCASFERYT